MIAFFQFFAKKTTLAASPVDNTTFTKPDIHADKEKAAVEKKQQIIEEIVKNSYPELKNAPESGIRAIIAHELAHIAY